MTSQRYSTSIENHPAGGAILTTQADATITISAAQSAPAPKTSCFLKKGYLTHKRFPTVRTARRYVALVHPTSTADIQAVHDELMAQDAGKSLAGEGKAAKEEGLKVLGQIALAAVSGTPLLIIGSGNRLFVHFSEVEAILDEDYLAVACHFNVLTTKAELRFSADSSIEYQEWSVALRNALDIARHSQEAPLPLSTTPAPHKGVLRERSIQGQQNGSRPRSLSRGPSQRSRRDEYEEEYTKPTPQRSNSRRSLSRGPPPQRESYYDDVEEDPYPRRRAVTEDEYDYDTYYDDYDRPLRRRPSAGAPSLRSTATTRRRSTTSGGFLDNLMSSSDAVGAARASGPSRRYTVDDDRWETASRMSRSSGRTGRRGPRSKSSGGAFNLVSLDLDEVYAAAGPPRRQSLARNGGAVNRRKSMERGRYYYDEY
ncbi:hypothetical protein BJ742DRAFT_855740 [Cladochytrium replicatum]|nr:hypothetical protein BJ742DRAFT_855740 [Cladochytrium replicatum]